MAEASNRQVFVAYSYKTYPKADYRPVFAALEKVYDVRFIFADEKITNMHIMQKIISHIRSSDFALFDVSGWNPNVTLELGFAMAESEDRWYILLNPNETDVKEVPSDLRGLDRIQYESYAELGQKLGALLEQRYPKRKPGATIDDYLNEQRENLRALMSEGNAGLTMKEISQLLGVEMNVARLIVEPLLGGSLHSTGATKGKRYHLKASASS